MSFLDYSQISGVQLSSLEFSSPFYCTMLRQPHYWVRLTQAPWSVSQLLWSEYHLFTDKGKISRHALSETNCQRPKFYDSRFIWWSRAKWFNVFRTFLMLALISGVWLGSVVSARSIGSRLQQLSGLTAVSLLFPMFSQSGNFPFLQKGNGDHVGPFTQILTSISSWINSSPVRYGVVNRSCFLLIMSWFWAIRWAVSALW